MSILLLSATLAFSQSDEANISSAMKLGNYKELSKFFDTKVELTILTKENNYSKAQAELIMKDFFSKDKVTNYQVIHQGSSRDGARYAIGSLTTATTTYRTYILTKAVNSSTRIQQLRFEANE